MTSSCDDVVVARRPTVVVVVAVAVLTAADCDVPTTLLLYNCVFAYVNDKFTYFFVCALLFGFLMIEPLLR